MKATHWAWSRLACSSGPNPAEVDLACRYSEAILVKVTNQFRTPAVRAGNSVVPRAAKAAASAMTPAERTARAKKAAAKSAVVRKKKAAKRSQS